MMTFVRLILLMFPTISYANNVCSNLAPVPYNGMIICVTYDYYKVHGIRTPVGLTEAYRIADDLDMLLPTKAMVDAIWRAGDIKLEPIIMPPTSQMTSVQYYVAHDRLINDQLSGMNLKNKLIVGIKKDIITINRLSSRVAIYGWHHLSGVPIQPYSLVHYREYYDYSHGLRLVSKIAYRNGIAITIR